MKMTNCSLRTGVVMIEIRDAVILSNNLLVDFFRHKIKQNQGVVLRGELSMSSD